MKSIAINLLWTSSHDQTGAFVYVKNLLDQLFKLDLETNFLLIIRWSDRHYFKSRYGQNQNVELYISDPRRDLIRRPLLAIKKIWAKWRKNESNLENLIAEELNRLIRRRQLEKMFFPTQMIYPRDLMGVEQLVTILDLQHEYLTENFSPQEVANRRSNLNYIVQTAHKIFAISEYTKQTLLEKTTWPAEKIIVTPLAPDDIVIKPRALNLTKPFLFYPAALWPHKNHRLVIEVLHQLSPAHPDLQVVFSGVLKKKGLKTKLDNLITKYQLTTRVHFLGFVSDENIAWLYQNAAMLIFPSSFEGFGMPLLEAYRYGLPVVAARNTSITEVAGDAAILCETNNISEFAAAIDKLLKNPQIKIELKPKMQKQLENFSWLKIAKTTLAVLLDK